jgi:hypothetical protein
MSGPFLYQRVLSTQTERASRDNDMAVHIRFKQCLVNKSCTIMLKWDIDAANIVTKAQALEPRGKGMKVDC